MNKVIKECIAVGCVPPARYRNGRGVSMTETETPPGQRPPVDRQIPVKT